MADSFHFTNGKTASTVGELLSVIEASEKRIFEEHVTAQRNDFAAWLEHSLQQKALADELRKTTDRFVTISALRAHMAKTGAAKPQPAPGAIAPPIQHHFLEQGHQREFLFGLAIGIILGVLLLRIVQVLA